MKKKVVLCSLPTPIVSLESVFLDVPGNNCLFIKRDDLTGFVLGGNKSRKLEYFMTHALHENCDYIVTYGSSQSNHCSATAAAAARFGYPCRLILAESEAEPKFAGNFFLYDLYGASTVVSKVDEVSERIHAEVTALKEQGYKPYFIPGGGHGNLGTHSYVETYQEIEKQKCELGLAFDFIFHASGTGTTQAGLIVGKEIKHNKEKVIGISIARTKARGIQVIRDSILEYSQEYQLNMDLDQLQQEINFVDDYIGKSYGDVYPEIISTIKHVAQKTGILLDPTYTGKAFYGMMEYLRKNDIRNKNILFIHTGGIPILLSNSSLFKE